MNDHFGIPGVGGSLGQCAFCGKPFLMEILMGEKVVAFNQDGIASTMYAHKPCMASAEKVKRWQDLPDGPLRQSFERHEVERQQRKALSNAISAGRSSEKTV